MATFLTLSTFSPCLVHSSYSTSIHTHTRRHKIQVDRCTLYNVHGLHQRCSRQNVYRSLEAKLLKSLICISTSTGIMAIRSTLTKCFTTLAFITYKLRKTFLVIENSGTSVGILKSILTFKLQLSIWGRYLWPRWQWCLIVLMSQNVLTAISWWEGIWECVDTSDGV